MLIDFGLLRCGVASGMLLVSPLLAVAQEDPFSEAPAEGRYDALAPGAVPGAAPAKEKTVLAVEAVELEAKRPAGGDFCRCVGESNSEAVARIEKALQGPLRSAGLDFTQTPLEEVVNLLQDEYGIPIQIDGPALEAIGLGPAEEVTVTIHNVSLASALRLMLKQLQLVSIIQDEVLLITTPEQAESRLSTCVYNVRDFIDDTNSESMDDLIDTIVSTIETGSWAENGGGEAEIRPLKPGLLVISQSQSVHKQIDGLLQAIREMRGPGGVAGGGSADVVTRLYALDVQGDAEKLGKQVREMIIQSVPDTQWDGKLPDGQTVMLTVLADRVVVRHTASVQNRVESLLRDSGVAKPVRSSEMRGRGSAEPRRGEKEVDNGGPKSTFHIPQIHAQRVDG
jgi:hypothetical protein